MSGFQEKYGQLLREVEDLRTPWGPTEAETIIVEVT